MACGGSDPSDDALSLGEQSGFLAELDVQDDTTLACSGSATTEPIGFENIDGVVALPTSPTHPALQTSARTAADGSTYYFAKAGLFWTSPAVFELSVPAALRSSLAIGWGDAAQAAHTVRMNCDDDNSWFALPGGYWVTEPMCADLIVSVNGVERTVQIGLGEACAGQDPPQGPTDG